jgi:acyl carrier protein
MSTDPTAQRLKTVLMRQLKMSLSPDRINDSTTLYGKGLGLDSVDVVTLITRIEEEFDIFFEPEDIGTSIKSFGALLESVRAKLEQKPLD